MYFLTFLIHFLVEVMLGDSPTMHTMRFPYLVKIGPSLLNGTRFYVSYGCYTIQAKINAHN